MEGEVTSDILCAQGLPRMILLGFDGSQNKENQMGAQDLIALMNSGLLQSDRIVKLDTPAGPNVLIPHIVVGTARLGEPIRMFVCEA